MLCYNATVYRKKYCGNTQNLLLQRVGCDLRIGSMKKVDACGVCGGDGMSCAQPLYHWEDVTISHCSATCGGGKYA